jgi:hypothetical protein
MSHEAWLTVLWGIARGAAELFLIWPIVELPNKWVSR